MPTKDANQTEKLYRIFVTTGALPNASLSANAFLQIFGKRKIERRSGKQRHDIWMAKFPLEKSGTAGKKFQAGKTDVFEVSETNVGKITKIRVSHDGVSNWHLKKIVIEMPEEEKYCKFYCNQWIGKTSHIDLYPLRDGESDSSSSETETDKKLNEGHKPSKKPKAKKIRYDIKIKTSNFSDRAESIAIRLIGLIAGKQVESGNMKLNTTASDNDKEKFLKDSLDLFKCEEEDVGTVERIQVFCGYNEVGKPIDWFYDEIIIDVPSKALRYIFNQKSNYSVAEEVKNTVIDIYPFETKKTSQSHIPYKVDLYIRKITEHKAHVLENLSVQFFGDFGHSSDLKPHQHKEKEHSDSINDIIHFHSRNPDLGQVFKIVLKQAIGSNKKIKTKWYLDRIKISHLKESFIFPFQKWITNYDKDKKVRKFEMKLYEEAYKSARKDFNHANNYSRTVSTLSHRLVNSATIDEDSYDESFDDERSSSSDDDLKNIRPGDKSRPPQSRSTSPPERRANKSRDHSRTERSHSPRNSRSHSGDKSKSDQRRSRTRSADKHSDFDTDLDESMTSLKSSEDKMRSRRKEDLKGPSKKYVSPYSQKVIKKTPASSLSEPATESAEYIADESDTKAYRTAFGTEKFGDDSKSDKLRSPREKRSESKWDGEHKSRHESNYERLSEMYDRLDPRRGLKEEGIEDKKRAGSKASRSGADAGDLNARRNFGLDKIQEEDDERLSTRGSVYNRSASSFSKQDLKLELDQSIQEDRVYEQKRPSTRSKYVDHGDIKDVPVGRSKYDDTPVGRSKYQNPDDIPVGPSRSKYQNPDDIPIGPSRSKYDDFPVGRSKYDDVPIGRSKYDDVPVGPSRSKYSNFDDILVGGRKSNQSFNFDDIPVGASRMKNNMY